LLGPGREYKLGEGRPHPATTMTQLNSLLLARAVHVIASTLWAGGAVLIAAFLMPAIRAAGPAGAVVMKQLTVVRKLPAILAISGIVAIVSGGYLYWTDSSGLQSAWMRSGAGSAHTLGAIAASLAAAVGLAINIPAANRMGAALRQLEESRPAATAHRPQKREQGRARLTQRV